MCSGPADAIGIAVVDVPVMGEAQGAESAVVALGVIVIGLAVKFLLDAMRKSLGLGTHRADQVECAACAFLDCVIVARFQPITVD